MRFGEIEGPARKVLALAARGSGTESVPELIDVELIVGRDESKSCVSKVGIRVDQVPKKPGALSDRSHPRGYRRACGPST